MIWIDLESKLPTDKDIPGWFPWSQVQWDAWKAESVRLIGELEKLNTAGMIKERNEFIDAHSSHWSKLKPWLSALSSGKCWFTEARDIASYKDVEHFRPKKSAKANNGSERDGYWWLAFDYMNFRLACNVPNRKKGTWFPLRYGSKTSTFSRQCEDEETPQFLDPTNAYDVGLLAFDEEGKAIPAPGISKWDKVRVLRSTIRLKLTEHQDLPEERRKVWQKTATAINGYYTALDKARVANANAAKQKLHERAREIQNLTKPTAELSAVARWCVLFRNDPKLTKLIA